MQANRKPRRAILAGDDTANLTSFAAHAWPATVAIVAALLARFLLLGAPTLCQEPAFWRHPGPNSLVLARSGLRGALTITLALALPPEAPERELLVATSFGVVLFTLLVQGTTLPLVLHKLGLVHTPLAIASGDLSACGYRVWHRCR